MTDGLFETQWTTNLPKQIGTEMVQIEFKGPVKFDAIKLDTSISPTDFPRGIRISASTGSCSAGRMETLFETPQWEGKIELSKEGLPYYAGQDEVVVFFKNEIQANCIRIEQISKGATFHWSITEVLLHIL